MNESLQPNTGLKFPKIKSPRRRVLMVNKDFNKSLKQRFEQKDIKIDKSSKYIRKGFELTKDPLKKINNMDNELNKILKQHEMSKDEKK